MPNVSRQEPRSAGADDAREAEKASAVTARSGLLDESVRFFLGSLDIVVTVNVLGAKERKNLDPTQSLQ